MKKLLFILFILLFSCTSTYTTKLRDVAEMYIMAEQYELAFRSLQESEKFERKNAHLYWLYGILFYKKGKNEKSIYYYKKAIKIDEKFSRARNNLGVVYLKQNKNDEAIETLLPILDDDGYLTIHFTYFLLGSAYFNKKDYKMAKKYLLLSLSVSPNYSAASAKLAKLNKIYK